MLEDSHSWLSGKISSFQSFFTGTWLATGGPKLNPVLVDGPKLNSDVSAATMPAIVTAVKKKLETCIFTGALSFCKVLFSRDAGGRRRASKRDGPFGSRQGVVVERQS